MFAFQSEIRSVRHGLSMLGEAEVRRWVRLVATVGAGQDKPSDLVLCALVRARFGELLSPLVPHGESDLFLLGLLSLIDAMLDMPMAEVLKRIPIDRATKDVLLAHPSPLRSIFQFILAHESGEWEATKSLAETLQLDPISPPVTTGRPSSGRATSPAAGDSASGERAGVRLPASGAVHWLGLSRDSERVSIRVWL